MSFNRKRIRVISTLVLMAFVLSTVSVSAQTGLPPLPPPPPTQNLDLSGLTNSLGLNPEVQMLQGNLLTMQNALKNIETTAAPLYNQVAPTNLEAMSIGERIKAIVGSTKNLLSQGVQSYKGQVNDWNAAHGITPNTPFEEELSVGLNQLGMETSKMPLGGAGNGLVEKLKTIVNAIKEKIGMIIAAIRAKIMAVAEKVGLVKKGTAQAKKDEMEKAKQREDEFAGYGTEAAAPQYADSFLGKLSKGVSEGAQNAKTSLKNSFSVQNLLLTTGVTVGTNLAIQMVHGEKPSLKKAVKLVASAEFAGSVVGSALGAAGGQFAGTLVKTFIPGPIGAIVGTLIPVMGSSLVGQMGSSLAGDLKSGRFDIRAAWQKVDKWDLVGSSIGSTIGMTLGAFIPIPVVGPLLGGIVGGFLGSKVAKWLKGGKQGGVVGGGLTNIFNRGSRFTPTPSSTTGVVIPSGQGVTFGGSGAMGGSGFAGGRVGVPMGEQTVGGASNLQAVEQQYYTKYLEYNRLVEKGDYDNAKKVYAELKVVSDQYQQLKGK